MAKVLGSSTVTSKFQITVPLKVRQDLEVEVGDTIAFVKENGKVFIATKVTL